MDFSLTEEQRIFRDTVRNFVQDQVIPVAGEIDERGAFPHKLFQKCAANGYFKLRYPETIGGMEADFLTFCLMAEEIAYGSLSLAAIVSMQCLMGTDFIYRFGTDEQIEHLLIPALNGEKIGTIAMTEPDFGSDLGGMLTKAVPKDGGWEISGRKTWITSATTADFFTVAAKTDMEAGFKGIDLFLIEKERPGVSIGKKIDKLGVRAAETSEVVFDEVLVPEDHLLGDLGTGYKNLRETLAEIRTMTGALSLGIGRAALDAAIHYSNERIQFNRPIGVFQAIAHKIARMATELEAARGLVYRAAWEISRGEGSMKLASMAKLFASEAANRLADQCTRIFGSYGFAMEFDAQRYYRDARFLLYGGGTSEILSTIIAKEVGAGKRPK